MLPSHRQCRLCQCVLTLDADNFYEFRGRFKWNLSRYGPACKPCTIKADALAAKARRAAKSLQGTLRRRLVQSNKKTASHFYTPQWLALQAQQDADAAERKARIAWVKRQFNRIRGPYRDPIKALIRAYQAEALRKRLTTPRDTQEPERLYVEQRDHLGLLEALRDKHRAEAHALSVQTA